MTERPACADVARPVRVLIVDDHRLLAESLCLALRCEGLEPKLAPVDDPRSVVDLVALERPDLVLLDLDLGQALGNGADLVAPLVALGARVLVLSGTTDPMWRAAAVEQGACGAIDKDIPFGDLLATVLAAARNEAVLAPQARLDMISSLRRDRVVRRQAMAPFERLTPREQQVLRALAQGMTVPRIADTWVVSEATVRSQVHAVLSKLSVRSQLEAVAAASRVGWV